MPLVLLWRRVKNSPKWGQTLPLEKERKDLYSWMFSNHF